MTISATENGMWKGTLLLTHVTIPSEIFFAYVQIKNALLMGAQRHPEDIREAQAAERLAMMVEDNEAVIGGGLEIMMPASVDDDGAELF